MRTKKRVLFLLTLLATITFVSIISAQDFEENAESSNFENELEFPVVESDKASAPNSNSDADAREKHEVAESSKRGETRTEDEANKHGKKIGWRAKSKVAPGTGGELFSHGSRLHGAGFPPPRSEDEAVIAYPERTPMPPGVGVLKVSGGNDFNLVLGDDGRVYSFGKNEHHRTCQYTFEGVTFEPAVVMSLPPTKQIVEIAAGAEHSLFLDEDGAVYVCGTNDYNRAGAGKGVPWMKNALKLETGQLEDGTEVTLPPFKLIAAGYLHSVFIGEDNSVWTAGMNEDGRTGLGVTTGTTPVPTKIESDVLDGVSWKKVVAGEFHTLLLSEDGRLFGFGGSAQGQIPGADAAVNARPIDLTPEDMTFVEIAAGPRSSMFIDNTNTLWVSGAGLHGSLCLATTETLAPIAVPMVDEDTGEPEVPVSLSIAKKHAVILTASGRAYVCGSHTAGRLGLGPTPKAENQQMVNKPTRIKYFSAPPGPNAPPNAKRKDRIQLPLERRILAVAASSQATLEVLEPRRVVCDGPNCVAM